MTNLPYSLEELFTLLGRAEGEIEGQRSMIHAFRERLAEQDAEIERLHDELARERARVRSLEAIGGITAYDRGFRKGAA